MAKTSPTQRTLKEARSLGFTAAVVERWNQYARVRQDLFGCIDIVALHEGVGILGIQATSGTNHAARRVKAAAVPALRDWLCAGGRFEIWSWRLKGAAGKRKMYELRREELTLDDLTSEVAPASAPTSGGAA
jgi:hypothetical protein